MNLEDIVYVDVIFKGYHIKAVDIIIIRCWTFVNT
jgi:hypothetical protein